MTRASALPIRTLAADHGVALFGAVRVREPVDSAIPAHAGTRLATAVRPIVVAGGPGWSDADSDQLKAFAEAHRLPVCCPGRYRDVFDHESPSFAGCLGEDEDPALAARLAAADLLIAIDAAHIPAVDAERIDLPVAALPAIAAPSGVSEERIAWTESANTDAVAWIEPTGERGGPLDLGYVLGWLRDRLPTDAVVTVEGAGFAARAPRHLLFRRPGRFVAAPEAAHGFAVPAAVAARLVHPKRVVVALTDAEGALDAADAFDEAAETGTAPLVIALNDRGAGAGVADTAAGHGAYAIAVERTRDFVPAFWDAMWSGRAAVIELRTA